MFEHSTADSPLSHWNHRTLHPCPLRHRPLACCFDSLLCRWLDESKFPDAIRPNFPNSVSTSLPETSVPWPVYGSLRTAKNRKVRLERIDNDGNEDSHFSAPRQTKPWDFPWLFEWDSMPSSSERSCKRLRICFSVVESRENCFNTSISLAQHLPNAVPRTLIDCTERHWMESVFVPSSSNLWPVPDCCCWPCSFDYIETDRPGIENTFALTPVRVARICYPWICLHDERIAMR